VSRLSRIKDRLGRLGGKKKDPGNAPAAVPKNAPIPSSPTTGSIPRLESAETDNLNIVNYSHAEVIQQVDATLSRVQFGMSRSRKYMHLIGDIWANIAPWVLCIGTVGEVFAFIWITITTSSTAKTVNGKVVIQTATHTQAWWILVSVFATIIALEMTFAVVSFKSAAIRGDAEQRPNGPNDNDRKTIAMYRVFWILLAIFVSLGQVAFLIGSSTQNFTIGVTAFFITFAILRTVGTMVGDYYTAFAHKETPTTGERANMELEERAAMASKLLTQKNQEITIINDGSMQVMRTQTHAKIERDTLTTEMKMKTLENENRVNTLQKQQEHANKIARMSTNIMDALFDPDMPDQKRERVLGGLQSLIQMNKQFQELPPAQRTRIEEEDR